jgi:hypothetical protein
MGNDFIQKAAKGFKKGFDRAHKRLTLAELGFRGTSKKIRTILCVPFGLENFSEGSMYELSLEDGRIFLYQDRKAVGVCKEPPRSIANSVKELGGKTFGSFHSIRGHSGIVEIVVGLPSAAEAIEAA